MHLRLWSILVLLTSFGLRAQPYFLDFPGAGAVRVYQVSSKEAAKLHSKPHAAITEKYLHTLFDSLSPVAATTKALPPGHYIYCSAVGLVERRELWTWRGIAVRPQMSEGEFRIQVVDQDNEAVTNAEVSWRGKKLKHRGEGVYAAFINKKRGLLRVKRGEDEYLGWWYEERDREVPLVLQSVGKAFSALGRAIARPFSPEFKGYVAFSKPKYKPGDTLRAKAYIVNQYGKPLRRKIYRHFYTNGEKAISQEEYVKPDRRGVFLFEFPFSDSLQLDKYYYLEYSRNPKSRSIDAGVLYEDYLLREAKFELTTRRVGRGARDSVQVVARATDANGLPLAGAEIHLQLKLEEIAQCEEKNGFWPDLLWEHRGEMGQEGSLSLSIPDSVFEGLSGQFLLSGELKTGNNELLKQDRSISLDGQRNAPPRFYLEKGMLRTEGMAGNGTLLGMLAGDTLEWRQVPLPLLWQVDTLVERYVLNTQRGNFALPMGGLGSCRVYGKHEGDSVFFHVSNPEGMIFRYSVFQGAKQIAQGKVAGEPDWEWKGPAKLGKEYRMEIGWHWAGKPESDWASASGKETKLQVEILHPERVQPGQQVQLKVKVTDLAGHSVPNADLTSAAVTDKFTSNKMPIPPRFQEKDRLSFNHQKWPYREYNRRIAHKVELTRERSGAFGIDSTEWLCMMLPPNGWYTRTLPTPDQSTQFAVFYPRGDDNLGFNAIWLDGQLVWIHTSGLSLDGPYAIAVTPGFHHLKMRGTDHQVEVENVWFPEGKKLEIFIDLEHPPQFARVSGASDLLTQNEHFDLLSQTLWILDEDSGRFGRIGQGNKQRLLRMSRAWQCGGIFKPGPVWYLPSPGADTIWIDFEPGSSYRLRDGFVFHDVGGQKHATSKVLYKSFMEVGEFLRPIEYYEKLQANVLSWMLARQNWSNETGQSHLFLENKLLSNTAFLFTVREKDRVAGLVEKQTMEIRNMPPGRYRFWRCMLDGSYQVGPELTVRENGTYFLRLEEEDFLAAARPESLRIVQGEGMEMLDFPLELLEDKFLPGRRGYLALKLVDGPKGTPLVDNPLRIEEMGGYSRFDYVTDSEGKATVKFPTERWYRIEVMGSEHSQTQGFDVPLYWRPGQVREMTIGAHVDWRASHGNSFRVNVGTPFPSPFKFPRLRLFSMIKFQFLKPKRFACLPARKGVRTNYINEIGGEEEGAFQFQYSQRITVDGQEQFTDLFGGGTVYRGQMDSVHTGEFSSPTDRLRVDFSDLAWWQPNLTTDENGEAFFQVTFPDDLTRWNAWAVAVSRKRQSGIDQAQIQSYRDLVAALQVPQFLVQGDQVNVRGEVVNRSGAPTTVSTSFEVAGKASTAKAHTLDRQMAESHSLTASGDSMQVTYRLKREDGYGDGESRPIPVYPRGLLRKEGGFVYFDQATTKSIPIDPKLGKVRLIVQGRALDYFRREIQKLEEYPYGCMEQTASRLIALVAKKRISTAQSIRFYQSNDIKALIRRLENAQQPSGAWGWWFEGRPNLFMTAWVCRALRAAEEQGFPTKTALAKGKEFLRDNLPREATATNLVLLRMAADLGIALDYEARLGAYRLRKPSVYDQVQIARIRQLAGLPFDWDAVWKLRKQSLSGGWYWGEASDDLLMNSLQATLIVYRMLESMPEQKPLQAQLRRFFLEQGEGLGRNTFETASVLEALLPYYLSQPYRTTGEVKLEVRATGWNDSRWIEHFPAEISLPAGSFDLRMLGSGQMFVSWYQEKREEAPQADTRYFEASTHLEQAGKRVESLESGKKATLVVEVNARSAGRYMMVEVPIPAGCTYGDKNVGRAPGEVHREHFRDRVCIFLQEMPEGLHTFKIDLEPRFSGTFSLNPAQVMPMYFPSLSGNNESRPVEIR